MPLILFNKPFQVLSQFTDSGDKTTLANFIGVPGVYPAGRLDYDSEGLLLLTDDGRLQARISEPRTKLPKVYRAQVEGIATESQIARLFDGMAIQGRQAYAVAARTIDEPANLWPRNPPIRQRKAIPTSWIEITIDEGRNRQVRRMTAAVGLPTLRLIRVSIGPWLLDELQPGESRDMECAEAWNQIRS